ncbi:DUF1015 domain-containing protein [bacterium]|nr:DUF1015 domain-containing protein [bacterium]
MTLEVKPLNAIVYNQDKVDINEVIAPPYDVISEKYRDELYERSPYNITRLILSSAENPYADASSSFENWLAHDVLVKCDKPVILYVLQKYNLNGKEVTRKGFIARNKIEDFSTKNILPHEFTMSGPKEDRLNLTKACKANFSQIFLVYSDPEKQIENAVDLSGTPFIDVTDDNGVRNVVYKIEDEKTISLIQNVLSDKTALIADGHHRYETAMNYRNFLGVNTGEANYVMSYFTNMDDDLLIYPTHRIITKWVQPYVLLESVKKYFDVKDYTFTGADKLSVKKQFLIDLEKSAQNKISMGLYMKNVNKFYLLSLRENVDAILDEYEVPDVLKTLDLTVLHKVIISKELGFTQEEQMAQDGIKYIKVENEAFDMIDLGKAEASFIMAYPKIEDIKRISEAGYRMPQKSTYFYPKLLSGVVINPLK